MTTITNRVVSGIQTAITAADAVRKDSDAYRYVIGLFNSQLFDAIEWAANKPGLFTMTRNYTEATGSLFNRLENCAKLLTLSPALNFFNGAYANKSYLYKMAHSALLAADVQTGIEFASTFGVGFSKLSDDLGKVNLYGITPKMAFNVVAQRASIIANGFLALDALARYKSSTNASFEKTESAKREAISYTADFALGVMVAHGVKNVPILATTAVACLAFKIHSVAYNAANARALAPVTGSATERTFIGKFWSYVQISQSSWEAKEKLMKMTFKLTVLAGEVFAKIPSEWSLISTQACFVEKLMENMAIISASAKLLVPDSSNNYLWNGTKAMLAGTISLFALKSLSNLSFGESLGFYKLSFSQYKFEGIPALKLVSLGLATSMTGFYALDAWNKARSHEDLILEETRVGKWKAIKKQFNSQWKADKLKKLEQDWADNVTYYGNDLPKKNRYEALLKLTPKAMIAANMERINYKIEKWSVEVVNEDNRVRQQTLALYTKVAKFAVVSLSLIVTILNKSSARVSLGLVALGCSVDAMGYVQTLDKESTQKKVAPQRPSNFYGPAAA